MRGAQERAAFAQYHADFANLLLHCDQNHYECDENKHELCITWQHALTSSTDNVRWLVRNERVIQRLLDYYISIRPGEKYRLYNNNSLPPFYQVINLCCEHEQFLERVSSHRNFDWATRYLFMETGDYPQVAEVLFEIIKKCAHLPEQRARHISVVLQYDKFNFCFDHLARFYELVLQTALDRQIFCEKRGLDFLTKVLPFNLFPKPL